MKDGGSIESFGAFLAEKYGSDKFCISKDALYQWFAKHKEFADAKELGLFYSAKFWESLGKAGIAGQLKRVISETFDANGKVTSREYAPATFGQAAWIFTMKNRFRWRDLHNVQHEDPNGKPLVPSGTTVILNIPDNGRDKPKG